MIDDAVERMTLRGPFGFGNDVDDDARQDLSDESRPTSGSLSQSSPKTVLTMSQDRSSSQSPQSQSGGDRLDEDLEGKVYG